ncbi:TonB-dependent receptor domain-containing protein [Stakelama marina]|uniref:TonB-dependent receptor domain-containing protein n=1 Tax=Stakelama marina TaxID=2826939 RepID=UPI0024C40ABC|nr:TonB-dependent receptor [Stakelama marina]
MLVGAVAAFASPAAAQSNDSNSQTTQSDSTSQSGAADQSTVPTQTDTASVADTGAGEIVVTGSRIRRKTFETVEPAVVLDDQFIQDRGFTNVAEALNQQPGFGIPGASTADAQGINNVGANYVNFFGLGSQRTLTVVNGRRFVGSNAPAAGNAGAPGLQVDLNTIPLELVDRIETISVGGAPTYGSDAIAGTVNIILKQDYQGMDLTSSYGISQRGDYADFRIAGTVGGNFAEGRGNVVVSVEHEHQEGLIQADRTKFNPPLSFQPNPNNTGPNDGIPDRVLISDPRVTFATFDGLPALFFGNPFIGAPIQDSSGNILQFTSNGRLRPFDPGTQYGLVFSQGGDGISLSDLGNLYTPIDRTIVTGLGHYDVTDGVTAYVETIYAHSRANDQISQAVWQTDFFPDDSGAVRFNVTNPFLDAGTASIIQDNCTANGLGADPANCDFFVAREGRSLTTGNNETRQNLFRVVTGLRGDVDLMDRTWHYDMSFNYGRTEANSQYNDIDQRRFDYALDVQALTAGTIAGLDPNGLYNVSRAGNVIMGLGQGEVQPGDIVCTVQVTPPAQAGGANSVPDQAPIRDAKECVPLNFFGEANTSAAARNYISAPLQASSLIEQKIFEAYASGELFDVWGGAVGLAFGYQHREESASFNPDVGYLTDIGRNQGTSATAGGFKTNEVYGELSIPLVSRDTNLPVVSSVLAEAKGRYVDNSTSGGDWTYTFGGRLGVFDDFLTIRGNYTRSIRSPALVELFLPTSTTFSFANDPCDQSNITAGNNPQNREANCRAEAAALGYNGIASFQSDIINGTRKGTTGGNADLKNEIADSYTIGAIIAPPMIRGLSLAADYVNIKIKDAISSLNLTSVMEACYDSANYPNQYCNLFSRLPGSDPARPFQVADGFSTGYKNAGYLNFQAVQGQLTYRTDIGRTFGSGQDLGQLTVNAQVFRLIQRETSVTGYDLSIATGTIGNPKWSGQLNIGWDLGKVTLFSQTRYIGKAIFSNNDTAESRDVPGVPAYWLENISVSFHPTDTFEMQLNVNNLFDTHQPYAAGASGSYYVYDQIGRYYRATAKLHF